MDKENRNEEEPSVDIAEGGKMWLAGISPDYEDEQENFYFFKVGFVEDKYFCPVNDMLQRTDERIALKGREVVLIKEMDEGEIMRFRSYEAVKSAAIRHSLNCVADKYFFDEYLKRRKANPSSEIAKAENVVQKMLANEEKLAVVEQRVSLKEFEDFERLEDFCMMKRREAQQKPNKKTEEAER